MRKTVLASALIAASAALPTLASAADEAAAAPAVSPVTGNFSLVSDYRFRGISQTKKGPAIQGGIDYAHPSGFYVGTWGSSVNSGSMYAGGAGLEMDLYGGYRGEIVPDLGFDVGYLYYYYSGANMKKNGGPDQKYNNQEIYASLSYAGLTGKVSYGLSDYFGLNSSSIGYGGGLPANGNSRGTIYYDLSYTREVVEKLNLIAHVGHTSYAHYGTLDYTDYKLGVTYDLKGWLLGAAYVGNSVKSKGEGFYTSLDTEGKQLWKDTVVLSVGKTF